MIIHFTEQFHRSYNNAPFDIQRAFDKQADRLAINWRHPSLRSKKYRYDKKLGVWIWQARVTKSWRFYFTIETDVYHILSIIPHPK